MTPCLASAASHLLNTPTGIKRFLSSAQNGGNPSDRYKLLISDGQWQVSAVLAQQFAQIVGNGQIKETSIVRLSQYMCHQQPNSTKK